MNTATTKAVAVLKKEGYIFTTLWCLDDIIMHGKDNGHTINYDQASAIADNIRANHDASTGVNWDSILSAIEEYFKVEA